VSRADTRFGRRGLCLALFAGVYIVYGFALAGSDPKRPGLELITRHVDLSVWAFLWITAGVLAIGLSVTRRSWLGYAALMPMPALWAVANLGAFVLSLGTDRGTPNAWAGALVWSLIAALLAIISGWPEPANGKGSL
jgi:hypothetical protein